MATEDEVRAQLSAIDGYSAWLGKREINALPSVLWEGERITGGVQGLYNNRVGMLIATDRRLIFIEKSLMGRLTVEDFPYDKITSIQYEVGWVFGKIKIFASGNRADIDQIAKGGVQAFAETIRARVSGGGAPAAGRGPTTASAASGGDVIEQLERLARLRDSGALDDGEFAQAKAKLLRS